MFLYFRKGAFVIQLFNALIHRPAEPLTPAANSIKYIVNGESVYFVSYQFRSLRPLSHIRTLIRFITQMPFELYLSIFGFYVYFVRIYTCRRRHFTVLYQPTDVIRRLSRSPRSARCVITALHHVSSNKN